MRMSRTREYQRSESHHDFHDEVQALLAEWGAVISKDLETAVQDKTKPQAIAALTIVRSLLLDLKNYDTVSYSSLFTWKTSIGKDGQPLVSRIKEWRINLSDNLMG